MNSNSRLDWFDVLRMLQADIARVGSQAAWARAFGVSRQFVGQVLGSQREPSTEMLDAIGVRSRTIRIYEPKEDAR